VRIDQVKQGRGRRVLLVQRQDLPVGRNPHATAA
jgi:hypothetical protein